MLLKPACRGCLAGSLHGPRRLAGLPPHRREAGVVAPMGIVMVEREPLEAGKVGQPERVTREAERAKLPVERRLARPTRLLKPRWPSQTQVKVARSAMTATSNGNPAFFWQTSTSSRRKTNHQLRVLV
jgi:hypothetical protein